MVKTGSNAVAGSWKIIATRLPRRSASALPVIAEDLVALELDAARPARAVLGMELQDRAQGDALARARFAQDAERLAALHVEADAVDRMHGAVGRHEGDVQILDLEQACSCQAPCQGALVWPEPRMRIWQATCLRAGRRSAAARRLAQTSSANGQRVRKRQPEGGSIGLGGSPWIGASLVRLRGSMRRPRRQQRPRVGVLRVAVDRVDRRRSRRSCRDT